jgi:hypothetical protein
MQPERRRDPPSPAVAENGDRRDLPGADAVRAEDDGGATERKGPGVAAGVCTMRIKSDV